MLASVTKQTMNDMLMMSYRECNAEGMSRRRSRWDRERFDGSHDGETVWLRLRSRPSSLVDGSMIFERSKSQRLGC